MKKFTIVFLALTLFGCNNEFQEESVRLASSKIIGSWQVIAQSYSIGGPLIVEKIEDGGIYHFKVDGAFTFTHLDEKNPDFSGNYTYKNEILLLNYMLPEERVQRSLKTSFEGTQMELIPIDIICIEGCSFTLKKLIY